MIKLLNLSALKLNDKHNYYGGAIGSIGYNLLYSLSNFDLEIHTLCAGADLANPLPTNLKLHIVNQKKNDFFFIKTMGKLVNKILNQEHFSLITHLYFYEPYFSPVQRKIKKYPFIIGMCEMPHPRLKDEIAGIDRNPIIKYLGKKAMFPLFKSTLRYCDMLIVINGGAKNYYSKFIPKDKIKIIPYGVNLTRFRYVELPSSHNILAVSRLIKRRGLDYLVEAMPLILREYPDAKLHFVGDGPRKGVLQAKAKELGVGSNVIFHGQVSPEELVNLYKNCFVFCHLSFADGWNQPALEAMSTGRPVICTDAPHNSMVENQKTGFLVSFGDVDTLAEKIMYLFENYKLAESMGIEGRRKVEKEHDWYKIAKGYYRVFSEVL